jgi:hypothetical protein
MFGDILGRGDKMVAELRTWNFSQFDVHSSFHQSLVQASLYGGNSKFENGSENYPSFLSHHYHPAHTSVQF